MQACCCCSWRKDWDCCFQFPIWHPMVEHHRQCSVHPSSLFSEHHPGSPPSPAYLDQLWHPLPPSIWDRSEFSVQSWPRLLDLDDILQQIIDLVKDEFHLLIGFINLLDQFIILLLVLGNVGELAVLNLLVEDALFPLKLACSGDLLINESTVFLNLLLHFLETARLFPDPVKYLAPADSDVLSDLLEVFAVLILK